MYLLIVVGAAVATAAAAVAISFKKTLETALAELNMSQKGINGTW